MDVMPRLQRWGRNALIPLIEKRLTVVELSQFVDPESSSIRRLILQQVENYEVIDEWKRFDQVPRRDRESYVEAVYNRANKFCASNNIRRIFGQEKSTIDFRKAMDEGKIILCNLASNKLSREEQDMLGVVICDKIVQAAKSRVDIPERRRRPFFFFLDEFGQYASEDIAIALQELRKFKVSFVLAHQELQQLEEDSRKLYSAVISEPQLKIAFRISRKDAEIMVGEFFTGKIRGDKEKRRIEQTKFWPKESTRVVEGDSDSWSEVESETKTGSSLDITRGESSIYAGGHTRSVVPFYEQIPFMEVSNINDYSIEEITEKFIAWLMNQPDRHAQMKVKQNPPIPIITPYVEQFQVRETDIMALKEKVYSRYALPAKEVDRMIEDRRNRFISEADGQGSLDRPNPAPALTPESMRHSIQSSSQSTRKNETVIRKEITSDDEDD